MTNKYLTVEEEYMNLCSNIHALCFYMFNCQDTVKLSRTRNFNPDYNGKQASLVTGVTDLGDHVTTPCSYDVDEIRVANSGIVSDALRTKRSKEKKDNIIFSMFVRSLFVCF